MRTRTLLVLATLMAAYLCTPKHATTDSSSRLHAPTASRPDAAEIGATVSACEAMRSTGSAGASRAFAFVENRGQWDDPSIAHAQAGGMRLFVESAGWVLALAEPRGPHASAEQASRAAAVRMSFQGARPARADFGGALPGRHNYLLGSDASRWRSGLPRWATLRLNELYPGVDVQLREEAGHVEYDLLLQPYARLQDVRVKVEGARRLWIDGGGSLVIDTELGPVRQSPPATWETGAYGERHAVVCRYEMHAGDEFGFVVSGREPSRALTIDPGLVWSTYLGGFVGDLLQDVATDASDAVYVGGHTNSFNFPTTMGAFDVQIDGSYDVFVTKLTGDAATLVYSTFLGGAHDDSAQALAVDATGSVAVAGSTESMDFPVTSGAFQSAAPALAVGFENGFVARLDPAGAALVFSTYLGGSGDDFVRALALDSGGDIVVGGMTHSSNFPTTPGSYGPPPAVQRGFITRIAASGSAILYSALLPAAAVNGLAIAANGEVVAAGSIKLPGFATPGAFDTTHNGDVDAFVLRLMASGSSLVYLTYLGASGRDEARDVAIDALGAATLVGSTSSPTFPVTPGAISTPVSVSEGFVARVSANGAALELSACIGGSRVDDAERVVLMPDGSPIVGGTTSSPDIQVTAGSFQATPPVIPPVRDAFITQLTRDGSGLVYSTYLGGTGQEILNALTLLADGSVIAGGVTGSTTYPVTTGVIQPATISFIEGFITRLDLLPSGVARYGASTPGCSGPLPIGVTGIPRVGDGAFGVTCMNAPPNAAGILAIGAAPLIPPLILVGAQVWIDPFGAGPILLPAFSDARGSVVVATPIPANPALASFQAFAQLFWVDGCASGAISASQALAISVQP
jgi:hypothetical protein